MHTGTALDEKTHAAAQNQGDVAVLRPSALSNAEESPPHFLSPDGVGGRQPAGSIGCKQNPDCRPLDHSRRGYHPAQS